MARKFFPRLARHPPERLRFFGCRYKGSAERHLHEPFGMPQFVIVKQIVEDSPLTATALGIGGF